MTRRAVVCGAGGFIGSHLVQRLADDGYWVRGVDLKQPEWSPSAADDFLVADLRDRLYQGDVAQMVCHLLDGGL